jgi:hypothetical protein
VGFLFSFLFQKQKGNQLIKNMKLIKRLSHDAKELKDAILGWDIFRCRDYSNVDGVIDKLSDIRGIKPIFGYTLILAANLKDRKFFKRLFIRT